MEPTPISTTAPLSQPDFLNQVAAVRHSLADLATHISTLSTLQQRSLTSPSSATSASLESTSAQTHALAASIRDRLRTLEADAARTPHSTVKHDQTRSLRTGLHTALQDLRRAELEHRERARDQARREWRVVLPDAPAAEIEAAVDAAPEEGAFGAALRARGVRAGGAESALAAVRARHADVRRVERSLEGLAGLFADLDEAVVGQEEPVRLVEEKAGEVVRDTKKGNEQLESAQRHLEKRNKMSKWMIWAVIVLVIVVAVVLAVYFTVGQK